MEALYRFKKDEIDEDMVKIYVQDRYKTWFVVGITYIDVLWEMLPEKEVRAIQDGVRTDIKFLGTFKKE